MQKEYTNTGAFFPVQKKNPKQPDIEGYVELDEALLQALLNQVKDGNTNVGKMRIAMWAKVSKRGQNFWSAVCSMPYAGGMETRDETYRNTPPPSQELDEDHIPF